MSQSMFDLFANQLQDLHGTEARLAGMYRDLSESVRNSELRAAFRKHSESHEVHIHRLNRVAEGLNMNAEGMASIASQSMVQEIEELLAGDYDDDVLDAGLIGSVQKIWHYKIGAYGTLCTWAKKLGFPDLAQVLFESLEEEKKADRALTRIAEAEVNHHAVSGVRHE